MRILTSPTQRHAVICLHSSGGTGRQWQPLADRLASTMHVVLPDLAGHGDGAAWSEQRGDILKVDADLVLDTARSFDGPVHLVGHSWGGAVALRAARADPNRFASVAVYEPVLFRVLRDRGERAAPAALIASIGRALRADLRGGHRRLAARRFVDFWNARGTFDALHPMRQEAVAARMPAVAAHFASLWNDAPGLAAYRALAMPVALYAGAQTHPGTRTIVELLSSVLPDARVQTMTAMGHMGPVTHPHIVAQTIVAFIRAQVRRIDDNVQAPVARAA